MIRFRFAAIATASLIALSAPAVAQMGSSMGADGMKGGNMPATCQGMMDKATPMMDSMADGSKKKMAMKHMGMAKMAMSAGHEKTCKSHMKTAMHGMM
jgi:hypothetical protein